MENLLIDSVYYKKFVELSGYSDKSIERYRSVLKELGEFIRVFGYRNDKLDFNKFYYSENDDEYEPIDLDFVDNYVEYLKEKKTKVTLGNHFSCAKSFFQFIEDLELIEENPFSRYPSSFHYRAIKNRALSKEESDSMLKAAAILDPFLLQYFVLILLQFTCGLRSREICSLKLSQIYFDLNVIVIDRKQKTFASSVLMTPALKKYLQVYINHPYFKEWLENSTDKELFFLKKRPLTNAKLNKIIREIASKAEIKRKVASHDLRATMAYLMDQNGFSLPAIQRQMRHKKPSTTLIYLPMKNRLKV
ncbi:site-specific integrase [Bacillus sp. 31A1R]|uniref:Site-specific integrase n=1 Tax=Robertmurraya mangrovi TaxID=3098077 RepID=A0ABU5IZW5_9BACI|nr:site-specific integrase [Bacillus sp. 31A1R]MDZ5472676.1 site-specific integrase [Bacillus sp. 31A1R]